MKKSVNYLAAQRSKQNSTVLVNRIVIFLKECSGKSESEIKELFSKHEQMWVTYAKGQNTSNHKTGVLVFEDAFEAGIINAHKTFKRSENMTQIEVDEYKRVFNIMRKKSKIELLFKWLGKHFFIREKQIRSVSLKKV